MRKDSMYLVKSGTPHKNDLDYMNGTDDKRTYLRADRNGSQFICLQGKTLTDTL